MGADGHRRQHARLRQFSEVQKPRDLDLDLGLGQCHISMNNTCRTTSMPNHLTVAVASSTSEIWHLNLVKYRHSPKFELS